MSSGNYLFTSESVSEGHPDKVCDQISDAIVDMFLAADPDDSRVACETLTTTNLIVLAGEVRGPAAVAGDKDAMVQAARDTVRRIGYEQDGFHWRNAEVQVHLHPQSVDIAQGVDAAGNKDIGAGDQGIMFGYACNETDVLMPAPIHYSHGILRRMAEDRHAGKTPQFGPDSKSQVTLRYVDTYGGAAPHGGGAFSGKDPTKVDRSAAYAARYLAKNIVGAGLADRCCIQLAYAIGVAKPLSIYVDTYGTGRCDEDRLVAFLSDSVDLSPRGIRTMLSLNRPIYASTAAYGHFGRQPDGEGHFSWERLDLAAELKPLLG